MTSIASARRCSLRLRAKQQKRFFWPIGSQQPKIEYLQFFAADQDVMDLAVDREAVGEVTEWQPCLLRREVVPPERIIHVETRELGTGLADDPAGRHMEDLEKAR